MDRKIRKTAITADENRKPKTKLEKARKPCKNGLPAAYLDNLQRIQNSAARLVCSLPRFCHVTPTLFSLHCLPVCFRIEFQSLILAFKAIHGLAPRYIMDLIEVKQQFGHMKLRSQAKLQLSPPRTITKRTLGG